MLKVLAIKPVNKINKYSSFCSDTYPRFALSCQFYLKMAATLSSKSFQTILQVFTHISAQYLVPMLPNLTQQFNIGNIVSLASYLYRSNFKKFSRLSLFAHLWLIVPIYGWAKFYAFAGLISRLAFSEISGQPESSKVAKIPIKKRFWQFLITAILVILICFLQFLIFYIGISLIAGIIYGILARFFGVISQPINQANPFDNTLFRIMIISIVIPVYFSPLWFYSRFFITDLPLAIEDDTNSIGAIKRSRQLSRGLTWRIRDFVEKGKEIALKYLCKVRFTSDSTGAT